MWDSTTKGPCPDLMGKVSSVQRRVPSPCRMVRAITHQLAVPHRKLNFNGDAPAVMEGKAFGIRQPQGMVPS